MYLLKTVRSSMVLLTAMVVGGLAFGQNPSPYCYKASGTINCSTFLTGANYPVEDEMACDACERTEEGEEGEEENGDPIYRYDCPGNTVYDVEEQHLDSTDDNVPIVSAQQRQVVRF